MQGRTQQAELCFETGEAPKPRRKARNWDAENRICARIILDHAERFGGPEALPVVWAHQILACEGTR